MGEIIIFLLVLAGMALRLMLNANQRSKRDKKTKGTHTESAASQTRKDGGRSASAQKAKNSKTSFAQKRKESASTAFAQKRKESASAASVQKRKESASAVFAQKRTESALTSFAQKGKKSVTAGSNSRKEERKAADILTAARENTWEVEMENDRDALMAGDLMDTVQDLITKGPKDTLAFQRDFVAEGTEMLNRYLTLPDSWDLQDPGSQSRI